LEKKQIKAAIKKLKYYDGSLTARDNLVSKITMDDIKELERFKKETEIVAELFMCHVYYSLPDSLDILVNPKQIITKQDAYQTIISPRDGVVEKSGYNFFHIPEERFKIMLELYKELSL
jgi:hypothetical protein